MIFSVFSALEEENSAFRVNFDVSLGLTLTPIPAKNTIKAISSVLTRVMYRFLGLLMVNLLCWRTF